jgi:hypothetical protein
MRQPEPISSGLCQLSGIYELTAGRRNIVFGYRALSGYAIQVHNYAPCVEYFVIIVIDIYIDFSTFWVGHPTADSVNRVASPILETPISGNDSPMRHIHNVFDGVSAGDLDNYPIARGPQYGHKRPDCIHC